MCVTQASTAVSNSNTLKRKHNKQTSASEQTGAHEPSMDIKGGIKTGILRQVSSYMDFYTSRLQIETTKGDKQTRPTVTVRTHRSGIWYQQFSMHLYQNSQRNRDLCVVT